MCLTDEQCVRRCLDGQPETFRVLVRRYQDRVASLMKARLGDENTAIEATQEALVRAYFALGKLRRPASFFSWLAGIADRVAKEAYRDDKRATGPLLSEPEASEGRDDERDSSLRAAVLKLPDKYQQVISLRFYGELSCKDIGTQLGLPLGTVTKRLSRAYGLLRESMRTRQENDVEVQS